MELLKTELSKNEFKEWFDESVEESTTLRKVITEVIDQSPKINSMQTDISTLKGDVSTLKGDVSTLKGDVSTLKSDVSKLTNKVSTLDDKVQNLGLFMEHMDSKLDKTLDAVTHHTTYGERLDEHNERLNQHDENFKILNFSVKKLTHDSKKLEKAKQS